MRSQGKFGGLVSNSPYPVNLPNFAAFINAR
jgi:hypothetical protein